LLKLAADAIEKEVLAKWLRDRLTATGDSNSR
jgi:hypothetical protein